MKRKIVFGLLASFVVFAFFLVFGYFNVFTSYNLQSSIENTISSASGKYEGLRNNYASKKMNYFDQSKSQTLTVDQKYEKIATISSSTSDFDLDRKGINDLIKKYEALIQYEQSSGAFTARRLELRIGVPPHRFEEMTEDIKKVGKLQSIQINKTDKTNEYRTLTAKQKSLEKTRNSLIGLKEKGGKIDELINLETKILEIEQEIQTLGVNLGDYDTENEFCTIDFSIYESSKPVEISIMNKLFKAFEWALKYFALTLFVIVLVVAGTYIVVLIFEKIIRMMRNKEL